MDDLSEKLAGILNDPESMNRVRQMAESLLGGQQDNEPPPQLPFQQSPSSSSPMAGLSSLLGGDGMPDMEELQKVVKILSKLKSDGQDSRTQLLVALKPHLSEPRQEKVDTAIKILRLIDLLPYLKESGILSL